MKILAIAADLDINNLGGAEAHFIEVLKRIAPRTEKVTVFTGPKAFKLDGVEVIPVSYPHIPGFFGLFYIIFATPLVIARLRKEKYDLIWAKQEYPQAQVGALVKLFTGLPLYVTSQNPRLHVEELTGWGRSFAFLLTPIISWAFRQADVVACVSQYSGNLARDFGAKNIVVIPNGVDPAKYGKAKDMDKKLKIVTVSSLIPRNGVDVLIKACKFLPENLGWKLTIAGDGPLRKELEELAKDKRITFLGRVENSKIPALLAKHNLFVRPSRYEGFGSAFIEAMAAGVPVIGTPVGGIPDFLVNRKTGVVVSPDDPEALAAAIAARQDFSGNAVKLVREKYDWDKIAKLVFTQMQKCSPD